MRGGDGGEIQIRGGDGGGIFAATHKGAGSAPSPRSSYHQPFI